MPAKMENFSLTIDGRAHAGASRFVVVNPATGAPLSDCPAASRAQLDEAMDAAARAFAGWRRDLAARRQALAECAAAVAARAGELGRLLTQEQGKPLKAAEREVQGAAHWLRATAALELPVEVLQDDAKLRVELRRRPLGVVAAITPWNFPLALAAIKIAPALLAGNTMVLKPSPYTPLATLKLGEILGAVLPPGVLNVLAGDDALGAWMSEHPTVRKISFTGSVATGKKVAAAAAADLKRVTLELGGNDPAIVLDDVDVAKVAPKLFWNAFQNSGQVCIAIKRLYVAETIFQPLVDALGELARAARVGDGLEPGVELGPLNNRPQLERVSALVDDALAAGGRAVTGGRRLERPGWFYPPTLVTGVGEGVRLIDEEQFGPALPILPFGSVDEAVARANATHFGLGGSVWSADAARGAEIAAELECGTGWVNHHSAMSPTVPFGGLKWSGIGVENGRWGLESFSELQVLSTSKV
jgi:acyl-CoA reductase-like NAD-dependent aldehyde dehydrogenase